MPCNVFWNAILQYLPFGQMLDVAISELYAIELRIRSDPSFKIHHSRREPFAIDVHHERSAEERVQSFLLSRNIDELFVRLWLRLIVALCLLIGSAHFFVFGFAFRLFLCLALCLLLVFVFCLFLCCLCLALCLLFGFGFALRLFLCFALCLFLDFGSALLQLLILILILIY